MGGFTMNIKIRRQKTEDRKQTSCLHRLKPATTHCSLLIAFCFLLLLLVGKVFADTQSISDISYNVIRITDGSSIDYTEAKKKGEFWHKTPFYLNLWLMDSDSKNRRQLTSGEVQDFAPRFTPDGKKVFFVSNRMNNKRDVWSINTD